MEYAKTKEPTKLNRSILFSARKTGEGIEIRGGHVGGNMAKSEEDRTTTTKEEWIRSSVGLTENSGGQHAGESNRGVGGTSVRCGGKSYKGSVLGVNGKPIKRLPKPKEHVTRTNIVHTTPPIHCSSRSPIDKYFKVATTVGPKGHSNLLKGFSDTRVPIMATESRARAPLVGGVSQVGIGVNSEIAGFKMPNFVEKSIRDKNYGAGFSVEGSLYLGTVDTTDSTVAGDVLATFKLEPKSFGGRLDTLSGLFEHWRPKSLWISYAPCVPTTTSGAIAGVMDMDPEDSFVPSGGTANILKASQHASFVQSSVWASQTSVAALVPDDVYLYTNDVDLDSPRWSELGFYTVIAASNFSVSQTVGNLYISYKFDFMGPTWENPTGHVTAGNGSVAGAIAALPFGNVFTTLPHSTGSVDYDLGAGGFVLPVGSWAICICYIGVTMTTNASTYGSAITQSLVLPANYVVNAAATYISFTNVVHVEPGALLARLFTPAIAAVASISTSQILIASCPQFDAPSYLTDHQRLDQIELALNKIEAVTNLF